MLRDPYDPNLFAGRDTDLQQIAAWLRNPGDRRLRSITGSPGSGKTWLLEKVSRQYTNHCIVLQTKAPALASPAGASREIDQLVTMAANRCDFKPDPLLDSILAPERRMEELGRQVCAHCSPRIPLLIVDGIDELAPQVGWNGVENLLLAFLRGGSCACALIARRDEQALGLFGLRLIEVVHPLGGFNPQETQDQVTKRFAYRHRLAPSPNFISFLQNQIPEYDGSHPSMNAFLVDRMAHWMARSPLTLTADDLEDCLRDTVGGLLSDQALDLLQVLCCQDDWTLTDLQDSGIHIDDPRIMELFHLGILVEAPPRYRIVEGFRGMARAWRRLRGDPC